MRFASAFSFFRRGAGAAPAQDPADMGTAFGMEASLAGEEEYRPAVTEYELESQRARASLESPLAWLSARRN